jgi:hypothetical protein
MVKVIVGLLVLLLLVAGYQAMNRGGNDTAHSSNDRAPARIASVFSV